MWGNNPAFRGLCGHFVPKGAHKLYHNSGTVMLPPLFLFRVALAIWVLLEFHLHFRTASSTSLKNVIGTLVGMVLNPQIALGSMDIMTIFILPVHKRRIPFHLFGSYSISFIPVLLFSVYRFSLHCFNSFLSILLSLMLLETGSFDFFFR